MSFVRVICLFLISSAILLVYSCNRDKIPAENPGKPVDTSVTRRLAVVSAAFIAGEKERGVQPSHTESVVFARDGVGVAYIEPFKGKFRVIHNGQAGRPYYAVSELSISSDGARVAYVARMDKEGSLYKIVVDGREGFAYGSDSNHGFSPDGKYHILTVTNNGKKYLVINDNVSRDHLIEAGPEISSDSSAIAFSVRSADSRGRQFIISDLKLQNETVFGSCGDYIVPNRDKSLLAVFCTEGDITSIKVIDFLERTVISDYKYEGRINRFNFAPDNRSVMYTVVREGLQRYVIYNGKEEKIPDGDEFFSDPLLLSDPDGVGIIIGTVFEARLYLAFHKQKQPEKGYGYISDLIASRDGRHHAYLAVNHNEERQYIVVDGNEGIKFDRIVSPIFSPDGKVVVYRARDAGRRFLVVSDLKGSIIKRGKDYDMVFQPVFVADGKSVAYAVLDGNELWWKVEKL